MESQRRSLRTTAVKAREIIREAVLPGSYISSPTGRQRRNSINSTSNSPAAKSDTSPYPANAVSSISLFPVPAAISGFTPKAKPPDMDVSGTIVLQKEDNTGESAEAAAKISAEATKNISAEFELPTVIEVIEPQNGTDIHKVMEGKDLAQEADVSSEQGKERQVTENLDHGEAMQVDNDQMQGGPHSFMMGITDDKRWGNLPKFGWPIKDK